MAVIDKSILPIFLKTQQSVSNLKRSLTMLRIDKGGHIWINESTWGKIKMG